MFNILSSEHKLTSAGFTSFIVCPNFLTRLYPNPSDPVFGYALEPVLIISLSKCLSLLMTNSLFLYSTLFTS